MGLPSIFIRLAGCNLNCTYCDSQYAKAGGFSIAIEKLCEHIKKYVCKRVLITGGEPLLQTEVHRLCNILLKDGYQVLLETNGSLDITPVPAVVIRIMDIKCPDSMEHMRVYWQNIEQLSATDEIKFVICSRADYEWTKYIIEQYNLKNNLLLGAAFEYLEPGELAGWILEDNLEVRFQLQIHKYIWNPQLTGV